MVKFESDKEFLIDNPYPCTLVIDTDMNGAWEHGYHEQLKYTFPRAFEIYKSMCFYNHQNAVGTSVVIEEAGYKIGILFTKKHRKTSPEETLKNFKKALANFLEKISSDTWIYSPILGRHDRMFPQYIIEINRLVSKDNFNWFVYKK